MLLLTRLLQLQTLSDPEALSADLVVDLQMATDRAFGTGGHHATASTVSSTSQLACDVKNVLAHTSPVACAEAGSVSCGCSCFLSSYHLLTVAQG